MSFASRATAALITTLALGSIPADAQAWKGKGRLEGRVTSTDGKPIAGASVQLRASRAGNSGPDVKTGKDGRWAVLGLLGADWQIVIEAPGYVPGKIVVTVSEVNRAPILEYSLEPIPVAAPAAPPSGLPPEILDAVTKGNDALEQKKFTDARVAFEKVSAAVPDNVSVLFALARSYSGEGNTPKAVETLRKVTQKEPENSGAWLLIAQFSLEKGDLDVGREALAKVPADAIKDPTVYINVGVLFMNKGKHQDAETYFDKAVALAPDQGEAYYYRGLSRVAISKKAEARADFSKFLELSPGSPDAKEARQLLEALK